MAEVCRDDQIRIPGTQLGYTSPIVDVGTDELLDAMTAGKP